jgi:hypothetical protein
LPVAAAKKAQTTIRVTFTSLNPNFGSAAESLTVRAYTDPDEETDHDSRS